MRAIRLIIAVLLAICVLFTVFFGASKINQTKSEESTYKGIITIWHIDTFEGGVGSRKQFLMSVARDFEKSNDGVLVMVIEHTIYSAEENMKSGNYPDMLSFGTGVDVNNLSPLSKDLASYSGCVGGTVGGKVYAVSWCRGGYVLIANPKKVSSIENVVSDIVISLAEYTEPLLALCLDGYSVENARLMSPKDAYYAFINGAPYLLGTQRDIHRLSTRGFEFIIKPIENYNDLYQYIAVTALTEYKRFYAEKFIEYLMSEKMQKKLNSVGMFSSILSVDCENEQLTSMQQLNSFKTISVFTAKEKLKEMQSLYVANTAEYQSWKIKINNMLL